MRWYDHPRPLAALRGVIGLFLTAVLVGTGCAYVLAGSTAGRFVGVAIVVLGVLYGVYVCRGMSTQFIRRP